MYSFLLMNVTIDFAGALSHDVTSITNQPLMLLDGSILDKARLFIDWICVHCRDS